MKVQKNCVSCGIDIGIVFHTQKYCKPCFERIVKERRKASSRRNRSECPPAIKVKTCIDCGVEFLNQWSNARRCRECKNVLAQCYFAIRRIRSEINTKSIVTPTEARGIVEDMLKEEGQEFTELMVNGMMNKILKRE
jgi:hypothetical protein